MGKIVKIVFLFLPSILIFSAISSSAYDMDKDGIDDVYEKEIAEKYAPILYFEKKEMLYPVSVEYHVSNSNLNRSEGNETILIDSSPDIKELSEYNDPEKNYYLDNRIGTVNDEKIINDYKEKEETLGYTVYAHVTQNKNLTLIQYWMFYAFNKGTLNNHEGDWEMVQITLENNTPLKAFYSQHIGGQKAEWKDVEKNGEHPKVYVARGSHANYFRYYQGKLGLASDYVGKNGKILRPKDYELVILGEKGEGNHVEEQNWMDFAGRWGDFGSAEDELRGKRGPFGPVYREDGEMWEGIEWGNSLSSLNKNTLKIEWFFYHFILIYIIFFIISLAIILISIYRKREKLKKPYFFLFNINGLNLRSIGNIIAIFGIIIAIFSLFNPWYGIFVDIDTGSYKTDGLTKIVSIDGQYGAQINLLKANSGMIQMASLPIPFAYLIIASIIFFILGTIGIEERKVGRKYVVRGIKFLIPVIIILVGIAMMGLVASNLAKGEGADDISNIFKNISSHPVKGEHLLNLPEYGSVYLKWGIEKGALFLILSGILLLLSGIIEFAVNKKD
ncbi:MAG TPA: DUF946 domain-containing protein [Thermoplasmatales archaeon]|nr:DUF946 domain-containing protein [Thermoplasmatales archaeon]